MPLGDGFYQKLLEVSSNVGMKPEDLLNVMAVESGLDPTAHNKHGDASGIVQFMPSTLKNLGYAGTHEDFRNLSGEEQLEYVEKLVKGMMKINGGPFTSAAQYYVGNFLPVALKLPGIRAGIADTIIVSQNPDKPHLPGVSINKEKLYYRSNPGLDYNKDGNITYGDIRSVLERASNGKNFKSAMSELSRTTGYVPKKYKSNVAQNDNALETMLNQFLHMVAANTKDIPLNNILIKVNSPSITNKIEFSRILCSALEEELMAKAFIHTNDKDVEIECIVSGPKKDCFNTVRQLSAAISDVFKIATSKIGSVEITTRCYLNNKSSYRPITCKTAEMQHRKFLLKFIGK